jgi:hypothetical protein
VTLFVAEPQRALAHAADDQLLAMSATSHWQIERSARTEKTSTKSVLPLAPALQLVYKYNVLKMCALPRANRLRAAERERPNARKRQLTEFFPLADRSERKKLPGVLSARLWRIPGKCRRAA